jgi:hypothetical protein
MFVYSMNNKYRPVLNLGPAPCEGGLLVVGISSQDFGQIRLRIRDYGLDRPSWITPQVNVFYPGTFIRPVTPFGRLPAELVDRIEASLMEYLFGHLLEPVDSPISN